MKSQCFTHLLLISKLTYFKNIYDFTLPSKVTAINSCIEVDLTGQVCADSIGEVMYSGFGGQIDFIRGAALGLDGKGKPIIAMPSVTTFFS
jgi:acyl-CoA hydrolase